jgi:toxin FitB
MNRRQALSLVVAAPLVLTGCRDDTNAVTRRFRLIATVLVDGERVEGSTVMEMIPNHSIGSRCMPLSPADYLAPWLLRKAAGRPISQFDCQIAAIARTHGATIATRNGRDFDGCGVEIIDPWRAV